MLECWVGQVDLRVEKTEGAVVRNEKSGEAEEGQGGAWFGGWTVGFRGMVEVGTAWLEGDLCV